MIKLERKKIHNKPYNYLTEYVRFGKKVKKIQVYIGKSIPKDLNKFFKLLEQKEVDFMAKNIDSIIDKKYTITKQEYLQVEKTRITLKYALAQISSAKVTAMWKGFAIKFIFESNAMEGSKLSASEVDAIVRNKYIKKMADRKEIIEVENALEAFTFIRSGNFRLNQRSIITLHSMITAGLGIVSGYKKHEIIVNNKKTTPKGKVREELTTLLEWYKKNKKTGNQFITSMIFHQRFEYIHPFEDGNGRTGRIILIWMLMQYEYNIILFKNSHRVTYFSSLDKADDGRVQKWIRYSMKVYRDTVSEMDFK